MSELFQTFHDNPENEKQALIVTKQDVEPYIEYAKTLRNDEDYTKKGIKNNFWHVGTLPQIVIDKWSREGFNIYHATTKELMTKIRSDPLAQGCITTTKNI